MRKVMVLVVLCVFFLFQSCVVLAAFIDNHDGTVTDTTTGLMWQKCSNGDYNPATGKCEGETHWAVPSWQDAVNYCESMALAGYDDWHLPTISQLQTLVVPGGDPTIDTTAFNDTFSGTYWSSTTYSSNSDFAEYVNFWNGRLGHAVKTNAGYVRAVRGGGQSCQVPSSGNVWTYQPVVHPVKNLNPANCKPFAVGNPSSGLLNLQVGLPACSSGVDIYLAIGFSNMLFMIDGANGLHLASGLTALPKWKANASTAVDESLYGDIPVSLLPAGSYNLYLLIVPAGAADFTRYYLWYTPFSIGH